MANTEVKNFYNETMPGKFGADSEYTRWFKDEIQRVGYAQTKDAITVHVLDDAILDPSFILELGPGAATWTKHLLARFPDASFDLLDISREMLARSHKAIGENAHVNYVESDILEWDPKGSYEFFFSSRVIEYIDYKKKFCEKIFSVLESNGRGFLITKMPHYERERLLRHAKSDLHQGQMAPAVLSETLMSVGFIDVDCYPVTMVFPFLHSAFANKWIGRLFGSRTLGFFGMLFAESYCVVFRKP